MRELRLVRSVGGALVVAAEDGEEYRLPVTQALRAQVRAASGPRDDPATVVRGAPPREIQALVRAGRTTDEIVRLTGATADQVRRFEGPVLAERSFVLEAARAVPVTVADATLSDSTGGTFGAVIDARLDGAEAHDRTWSSAKDPEHGWIVRVAYTTADVERESAWRFDAKKHVLAPHAGDAHVLSQHSVDPGPLVPRLRAVDPGAPEHEAVPRATDDAPASAGTRGGGARFDSGAFHLDPLPEAEVLVDRPPSRPDHRTPAAWAGVNRDPEGAPADGDRTADLLEALRRRRGEREAARFHDEGEGATGPVTGTIRIVDVPLGDLGAPVPDPVDEPEAPVAPAPERSSRPGRPRRPGADDAPRPTSATPRKRSGRASMPSWDEIVFGARPDDGSS